MKKLFITFFVLTVSLTLLTLFVGVSKTLPKAIISSHNPHQYDDPKIPIKEIHITVFYFIPKDKQATAISNWQAITESHLENLQQFHTLQFSGASIITYSFFPVTIIGLKNSKEYSTITEHNNNEALTIVANEITSRVYTPTGDLNSNQQNNNRAVSVKNVNLVIFEGEGAAGNGDFGLVSRYYLTDNAYTLHGSTYLAHEFYHTLGVPDHYKESVRVYEDGQQVPVSMLTSTDIMANVTTPITNTYLDQEVLKKMGM